MTGAAADARDGALAVNIVHFVRALRAAGLPLGPAAVLRAVEAATLTGLGSRADLRAGFRAVLLTRPDQGPVFDGVFDRFWTRHNLMEQMIAALSPAGQPRTKRPAAAQAGATRVAEALGGRGNRADPMPSLDLDARSSVSDAEVLRRRDFAQMSVAELARAEAAIARLALPADSQPVRRLAPDPKGRRPDPRASFRRSLRGGGGAITLARRAPRRRPVPVVALVDVSGSMSDYTRLFLHFLHHLGQGRRVHAFLFGTRLTNVTRALAAKDIDEALAECSAAVPDWSGGTRIAGALHAFNRDWARRVLGQGARLLLFTDGLERGDPAALGAEMARLHRLARRVVWLNPLLRFDGFAARAGGIRAMLPHVDEFRPVHSLASMAELCAALSGAGGAVTDPRAWLRRTGG